MAVRSRTLWLTVRPFLACGYLCLLLVMTHLPGESLASIETLLDQGRDKFLHALCYAGLSWLWVIGRSPPLSRAGLGMLAAALAGFAALDEWTQQWVPGRGPELSDWLSDLVGIFLGLAAGAWHTRRLR